ncbi:hypothetical protein [Nigerium sp.]|jgi:hypothetical protein|uniref:hypothetical protein n=1 Tax=Nigerium sp. TaxID=2042655 RepID=UPI0032218729
MSDPEWYYCLKHHAVEARDGCKAEDRLGPYATREEASHALEKVAERNEEWDNDPRYHDDDEGDSADDRDGVGPFGG